MCLVNSQMVNYRKSTKPKHKQQIIIINRAQMKEVQSKQKYKEIINKDTL